MRKSQRTGNSTLIKNKFIDFPKEDGGFVSNMNIENENLEFTYSLFAYLLGEFVNQLNPDKAAIYFKQNNIEMTEDLYNAGKYIYNNFKPSTALELASYQLFRIDLWLASNPQFAGIRIKLIPYFIEQLKIKFNTMLKVTKQYIVDPIDEVIISRFNYYGKILNESNLENITDITISPFINLFNTSLSSNDIKIYSDGLPVMITSAFSHFLINIFLLSFCKDTVERCAMIFNYLFDISTNTLDKILYKEVRLPREIVNPN